MLEIPAEEQPRLFIALPCYGDMPAHFVRCLASVIQKPPCSLVVKMAIGDSLVARARNTLTADFLASDCTHLLFIDVDLIFSGEHIARLLSHNEPVVGGFYPKKQDGNLEWVCNAHLDFPPPGPSRTGGCPDLQSLRYIGTGFMLIQRQVFVKMIEAHPEMTYTADGSGREEHDFWKVGVYPEANCRAGASPAIIRPGKRRACPTNQQSKGRYLSEDWFFCQRALDLGYKVYGDTRVILKHLGAASYPLQSQLPALSA